MSSISRTTRRRGNKIKTNSETSTQFRLCSKKLHDKTALNFTTYNGWRGFVHRSHRTVNIFISTIQNTPNSKLEERIIIQDFVHRNHRTVKFFISTIHNTPNSKLEERIIIYLRKKHSSAQELRKTALPQGNYTGQFVGLRLFYNIIQ